MTHNTAKFRKNTPPKSPARGTFPLTTTTACREGRERVLGRALLWVRMGFLESDTGCDRFFLLR